MLRRVENWAENVSPKLEFLIVILAAFGYFCVRSFFSLFSSSREAVITGNHITSLLVYESVVLLILGWFLRKRGWRLAQLGVIANWKTTLIGIGLVLVAQIAYILAWIALALLFPEVQQISQSKSLSVSNLALWKIFLVSILNPLYEEIFVCGYVITFLKKSKNLWFAIAISTVIRTAYHLYQPLWGIVAIISIGLVFGYVYAKTNRLWSVMVAHAIFDFVGLFAHSLRA